jgi:hypothetical protein
MEPRKLLTVLRSDILGCTVETQLMTACSQDCSCCYGMFDLRFPEVIITVCLQYSSVSLLYLHASPIGKAYTRFV